MAVLRVWFWRKFAQWVLFIFGSLYVLLGAHLLKKNTGFSYKIIKNYAEKEKSYVGRLQKMPKMRERNAACMCVSKSVFIIVASASTDNRYLLGLVKIFKTNKVLNSVQSWPNQIDCGQFQIMKNYILPNSD